MKLRNILGLSICALTLGLGFTACSDDDDDNNGGTDPKILELSGTWKHSETVADVEVTDPEIKDAVIEAVEAITDSEDNVYVFKIDGTFESKESSEAEAVKGTFKLDGEKITLTGGEASEVLAYKEKAIQSSVDVKAKVAEQLEIEESVITKALQVNSFTKITK